VCELSPCADSLCNALNSPAAVYGNDYKGNTCGVDKDVSSRKYTVYPRVNEVRTRGHVPAPASEARVTTR